MIVLRCNFSAPAARSASTPSRPTRASCRSTSRIIRSSGPNSKSACAFCGSTEVVPRRGRHRRSGRPHVRLLRYGLLREAPVAERAEGRRRNDRSALVAEGLSKRYGSIVACDAHLVLRSGKARRWRSSASRVGQDDAPASRFRPASNPNSGGRPISHARRRRACATLRTCPPPSGARSCAPTGASSIRMRRRACA